MSLVRNVPVKKIPRIWIITKCPRKDMKRNIHTNMYERYVQLKKYPCKDV